MAATVSEAVKALRESIKLHLPDDTNEENFVERLFVSATALAEAVQNGFFEAFEDEDDALRRLDAEGTGGPTGRCVMALSDFPAKPQPQFNPYTGKRLGHRIGDIRPLAPRYDMFTGKRLNAPEPTREEIRQQIKQAGLPLILKEARLPEKPTHDDVRQQVQQAGLRLR